MQNYCSRKTLLPLPKIRLPLLPVLSLPPVLILQAQLLLLLKHDFFSLLLILLLPLLPLLLLLSLQRFVVYALRLIIFLWISATDFASAQPLRLRQ